MLRKHAKLQTVLRVLGWGFLAGWVILLAGCPRVVVQIPQAQEVRGLAVYKDGRPIAGGAVEFRLLRDPSIRAVGIIEQDGSFVLQTLVADQKVDGIPPGLYKVTIAPPADMGQSHSPYVFPNFEVKPNQREIRLEIVGFPSNAGG